MVARRLLAVMFVAGLALFLPATAHAATEATSSAAAERALVDLVNDRRAAAGAPALTARADLYDIARDWAFAQAERSKLAHNPQLTSRACCWLKIGENVARAGGHGGGATALASTLMDLWRNSPSHDQTMTDADYDQIGLGVVVDDDGTAWASAVFRRCDGTSCNGGNQGPASDTTVSWAPQAQPPAPEPAPEPEPEPEPEPQPEPEPEPEPAPKPEPAEEPSPTAPPSPSPSPSPAPPSPSPSPAPSPSPSPSPSPTPSPSPVETPTPENTPLEPVDVVGEPSRASAGGGALLVLVGTALAVGTALSTRRGS